jgi:hypothetical protein
MATQYATIDMGDIGKKSWWEDGIRDAAMRAVGETQNNILDMFNLTVSTWRHKPDFNKSPIKLSGLSISADVSTTDENYVRVNFGTPPRIIVAKNKPMSFYPGFTPKTRRGSLGPSGGGSGGKKIARYKVGTIKRHAIEARNFDVEIKDRAQPMLRENLVENLRKWAK